MKKMIIIVFLAVLFFTGCTIFSMFINNRIVVTIKNSTDDQIEFSVERHYNSLFEESIPAHKDLSTEIGIGQDSSAFVSFIILEPYIDTIVEKIEFGYRYELTILGEDSYYWAFTPDSE